MKSAGKIAVVLFVIGLAFLDSANAQSHREREHREREWHGDIRVFHQRDIPRWRRGHWVHVRHAGRIAWWWVVDGVWYAYPAPVYPYPDPYVPPIVVAPPAVAQAPAGGPPPPAMSQPAPQPPTSGQPSMWYHCDSAQRYYPYVPECPSGWRAVPATPAPGSG
ncbi:MAG: hypothetical protein ACXWIS_11950 [Burkholderiales bacterium]